jgi:ribonuclease HII
MLLPYLNSDLVEAGCDEVGRGCLAGPVVAAAVILPKTYSNSVLNDSKLLGKSVREALELDIKKNAIGWAIAEVDNDVVDELNVLNASILGMHTALDMLAGQLEFILVDGPMFKNYHNMPHLCVVKGDSKFASIAAASIVAKNHRDRLMYKLAIDHSEYGWQTNVGYPTKVHREAIVKYGLTKYHRRTFCKKIG